MVGSNTVSQADKLNGADSHGSHGKVLGGIWDRIPLFWRFQLVGWLAFMIFSSPSKWVMLETIPTSVLVPLYRDGLGFLISIGMREICRRCYSEKIPKAAFVGPVGAFRVSLSFLAATYIFLQVFLAGK
jgi:hypothetical protein